MRAVRPLLAVAFVAALAGCQMGPDVAGTWDMSSPAMAGQNAKATVTLTKPEKAVTEVVISGSASSAAMGMPESAKLTVKIDGTYSFKDGKLTLTPGSATVTETGLTGVAKNSFQQMKPMIEGQAKQQAGNVTESEVKWDGNDKFTATVGGESVTFTRVK